MFGISLHRNKSIALEVSRIAHFKSHQVTDVFFWRTRQVDQLAVIANGGQRFADAEGEEWAVVAEAEQENHRHYDIRPDQNLEARHGV